VEEQEPNPLKEDPRDFALWKANKPATEDTWWDSPWGHGRPGWHIECSAMAEEIYGPAFEIHGGGLDLVFPHHENEVAQSRSLGHPFAAIWAHNGMLHQTGEKMAKSVGNIVTLREALDEWGRETLLVFFLTASWRKPIDLSDETLRQAAARLETIRNAFTRSAAPLDPSGWAAFSAALEDDFDTPAALAVMHEWASSGQLDLLRRGLAVFGLGSVAELEDAPSDVVELAGRRASARAARDFETSDRLRDDLAALGWEMRDGPDGRYDLVRV
jgi:cysteinyl-tRNA synthetase